MKQKGKDKNTVILALALITILFVPQLKGSEMEINMRIEEFIAQVKNPYCCICDGIIVKMKFSDQETTLEEKLKNYFSSI